jgi:Domain of unknown function (DUF3850)
VTRELPTPHELRCWPEPFAAIVAGRKRFEWRYNDRDYRVGDLLLLREFSPDTDSYTGRQSLQLVTYVLYKDFGMPAGYVCMSIDPVPQAPP